MNDLGDKVIDAKLPDVMNRLCSLQERWAGESEYEDWADYVKAMKSYCEHHEMEFVKLTKRPFELQFNLSDNLVKVRILKREIRVGRTKLETDNVR